MLFNSFPFVFLVAAALAAYYCPPLRHWQVPCLIVTSLIFYAYGQPALVALLLLSIVINATASYLVLAAVDPGRRKACAVAGVAANLSVLLFFKYGPLTARTFGLPVDDPGSIGHFLVSIPLPVGISFSRFRASVWSSTSFARNRADRRLFRPPAFGVI